MENVSVSDDGAYVDRGGRPASTSAHELAAHAQRLFIENGFDQTSVEDIATAVGVSRRTFFRYFPTKADVIWVESDAEHALFESLLIPESGGPSPWETVTSAFVAALDHGRAQDEWALHRARLILFEPAVQAQAGQVYRRWRDSVVRFVAECTGSCPDDAPPLVAGHAAIAASTAAHEYWINHPDRSVGDCIRLMFGIMTPASLMSGPLSTSAGRTSPRDRRC